MMPLRQALIAASACRRRPLLPTTAALCTACPVRRWHE